DDGVGFAVRCLGGERITTSTAFSNRSHASGCSSTPCRSGFLTGVFAMTEERTQYILDFQHMGVFGTIVQNFARHEYLMQAIMAALLSAPLSNAALITAGLGYSGKRDALLACCEMSRCPTIKWNASGGSSENSTNTTS